MVPRKKILKHTPEFIEKIDSILKDALAVHSPIAGMIQVFSNEFQGLLTVVHHGFDEKFLEFFEVVKATDSCVCARALRYAAQTSVYDIREDRDFIPYLKNLGKIPFVSVQSTPVLGQDGIVVGMISTHFAKPTKLIDYHLDALKSISIEASKIIEHHCPDIKPTFM